MVEGKKGFGEGAGLRGGGRVAEGRESWGTRGAREMDSFGGGVRDLVKEQRGGDGGGAGEAIYLAACCAWRCRSCMAAAC